MAGSKVEICGADTASLPVLTNERKTFGVRHRAIRFLRYRATTTTEATMTWLSDFVGWGLVSRRKARYMGVMAAAMLLYFHLACGAVSFGGR